MFGARGKTYQSILFIKVTCQRKFYWGILNSFAEKANINAEVIKLKNNLKDQTSPYLLQHADNPVHWYPWCKEAFEKAKKENKPIFLSIGYSTCHWCHVMAHESFEDEEVAEELNRNFISIKVDKEERPDIDSIYMSVCMMLTGSGGWPTSIFMTPEQKPFYAGTYFPKNPSYGSIGFLGLLKIIHEKWTQNEDSLVKTGEEITRQLKRYTEGETQQFAENGESQGIYEKLSEQAFLWFWNSFDRVNGGFGKAPKFPTPHNLMFLMEYYRVTGEEHALEMAEKTLLQMYKGGIFDHIGYGFSRYSTDNYFLVPHFEKMLYDNALLLLSYTKAFSITGKNIYRKIAEKTADYILREMTSPEGGFYSAQDADSEGVEGRYYVFDYNEMIELLGSEKGKQFNDYYNITKQGNFEGKNIPNRLKASDDLGEEKFEESIAKVYSYRKERAKLHLDDKILTSWNGMMIGALAMMYRIFGKEVYLQQAKAACDFIEQHQQEEDVLFVSCREGRCQGKGFLDDYAFYGFALINLYEATLDRSYLDKAIRYCKKAIADFGDKEQGGFYLYGRENEQLILIPKETYDGAIPSGNSVMAYNLVKLRNLLLENEWQEQAEKQLEFLTSCAAEAGESSAFLGGNAKAAGQSFFLTALSIYQNPPEHIVCVVKDKSDLEKLKAKMQQGADILVFEEETAEYKRINDRTTLYICKAHSCMPPVNL